MASFSDYLANSSAWTAKVKEQEAEAAAPIPRRLLPQTFYINKLPLCSSLPAETKRWVRNAADERAAIEMGCRFSEAMGEYTVKWVEDNCVLYEGANADDSMILGDWQYEAFMQGFGWLWFDPEWEIKEAGKGWLRRFQKLSGWVPKKNGKSPTLASFGLYLFAGDGEKGQKCFSLATTRDQALIAHNHALNFIRKSPALRSHCKIDAGTGEITDLWTQSVYKILCGDKGSFTTSKEGINGQLVIDETHVVNAMLMKVVKWAGISRRQPYTIQLSTAGSDTGGYGFDQYTLGVQNLKHAEEGRDYDYRLLHFEHGISQKTSIDELRDPEKIDRFIIQSNPTLGRIVSFTEAKNTWKQALRSDTELIDYAMYRLNQWNTGGGSYIAGADWDRCSHLFQMADVREHPCVIGVDLSNKSDMTAVVIVWAVPETRLFPVNPFDPDSLTEEREINVPYVMPYFWVPRRTVQQYAGHLDIGNLAARKQLFITETPTIRVEAIAEQLNHLDSLFDVRGIGADTYRSKSLAAILNAVHGWNTDDKMFLLSQAPSAVSPGVEHIHHCVLSKEIKHNGNPIMDWQLGNIVLIEDNNGNRRYEKPSHNSYKKIDGWAALCNAFTVMMNEPDLYPGTTLSIKLTA